MIWAFPSRAGQEKLDRAYDSVKTATPAVPETPYPLAYCKIIGGVADARWSPHEPRYHVQLL